MCFFFKKQEKNWNKIAGHLAKTKTKRQTYNVDFSSREKEMDEYNIYTTIAYHV